MEVKHQETPPPSGRMGASPLQVAEPQPSTSNGGRQTNPEIDEANQLAGNLILGAEQHKAVVAAPRGKSDAINFANFPQSQCMPVLDGDDDDFFHLTCHVEPALRTKIEMGGLWNLKNFYPEIVSHIN